jgi:hypothetical protein
LLDPSYGNGSVGIGSVGSWMIGVFVAAGLVFVGMGWVAVGGRADGDVRVAAPPGDVLVGPGCALAAGAPVGLNVVPG